MELGPERPSPSWFWDPNSIIGVFMDPLGSISKRRLLSGRLPPKATDQALFNQEVQLSGTVNGG